MTTPAALYDRFAWLVKPCKPRDGEGYVKKRCLRQTIEDVAENHGLTWQELADFNWGTAALPEVNWYLKEYNGCTTEVTIHDGKTYEISPDDTWQYLWTPRKTKTNLAKRLRTPGRQDVGHVAPDKPDGQHINTLVIRPIYEISLELGDVDALFESDANGRPTDKGRQQRLQALGYLYRPLKHPQIDEAYAAANRYFSNVHKEPDKQRPTGPYLDALLRAETQNNILAVWNDEFPRRAQILEGRLPQPGEFAMVRLPGGYMKNWPRVGKKAKGTHLTKPTFASLSQVAEAADWLKRKYDLGQGSDRFRHEAMYYEENELLGKIPLVVHVQRIKQDGTRVPAEGVSVYFQLIDPDPLDRNNPLTAPPLHDKEMDYSKDRTTDAPPFHFTSRGPKRFVEAVCNDPASQCADDQDPRRNNCPTKFGGKRDDPVAGTIFEVNATRPGLHAPRSRNHADYGLLYAATPVPDDLAQQHKYAVVTKTNDKGNAGVIFTPSRQGGDAYKIRAYIGPETLEFDGSDPDGPVVETGTLVIWRNLRFARYVQQPKKHAAAKNFPAALINLFRNSQVPGFKGAGGGKFLWDITRLDLPVPKVAVTDADGPESMAPSDKEEEIEDPNNSNAKIKQANPTYRTEPVQALSLVQQFRRYYCELLVDALQTPEPMDPNELRDAVQALKDAAAQSGEVVKKVDWDLLIFYEPDSPFLINIRSQKEYNDTRDQAQFPNRLEEADLKEIATALFYHGIWALQEHFAREHLFSGITLIQFPAQDTWVFVEPDNGVLNAAAALSAGGILLPAMIWNLGDHSKSVSSTVAHEIGHLLTFEHQPPIPNDGNAFMHEPQVKPPSAATDVSCVCIMSYKGQYGRFCGRCALTLRGWRTKFAKKHETDPNYA